MLVNSFIVRAMDNSDSITDLQKQLIIRCMSNTRKRLHILMMNPDQISCKYNFQVQYTCLRIADQKDLVLTDQRSG